MTDIVLLPAPSAAGENILRITHTLNKHWKCTHMASDVHVHACSHVIVCMHATSPNPPDGFNTNTLMVCCLWHYTVGPSPCSFSLIWRLSSHISSVLYSLDFHHYSKKTTKKSLPLSLSISLRNRQISSSRSKFRLLSNSDRELNSFQSIPVHDPRRCYSRESGPSSFLHQKMVIPKPRVTWHIIM